MRIVLNSALRAAFRKCYTILYLLNFFMIFCPFNDLSFVGYVQNILYFFEKDLLISLPYYLLYKCFFKGDSLTRFWRAANDFDG